MNTKQLKYARVLAKTGSFSKAASELGISQPSLSQYIKKIEQEVGVELFDRAGSFVRLTDAGKVYIEAGERILTIERDMEREFLDVKDFKTGTLTVGMSPYRANCVLTRVAKEFKKIYPGIKLVIKESPMDELIENAQSGEYDLTILTDFESEEFVREKIGEEETVLAVCEEFFKDLSLKNVKGEQYPVFDVSKLSGVSVISGSENQTGQRVLEKLEDKYGLKCKIDILVKRYEMQLELVRAGLGVAVIPNGLDEGDGVKYLSLGEDKEKRDIYAIVRKNGKTTSVCRDFIELLKKEKGL